MASSSPSDTDRHLSAEYAALKEHIEQLAVALEQAAKTEGTEALKAFSERARTRPSSLPPRAANTLKTRSASSRSLPSA